MKCSKVHRLLSEFAAGDLSPVRMTEVREHLAQCPECREASRSYVEFHQLMTRIDEPEVDAKSAEKLWADLRPQLQRRCDSLPFLTCMRYRVDPLITFLTAPFVPPFRDSLASLAVVGCLFLGLWMIKPVAVQTTSADMGGSPGFVQERVIPNQQVYRVRYNPLPTSQYRSERPSAKRIEKIALDQLVRL